MSEYYVYIMTNKSGTLYTEVTNDLHRRVFEHKHKLTPGFTSRYNITLLLYFESAGDIRDAIARETQIKGWLRAKKIALIRSMNPNWEDLSAGWYGDVAGACHSEPKAKSLWSGGRDASLRSA